jgi:SAM-dependent methyltransferase
VLVQARTHDTRASAGAAVPVLAGATAAGWRVEDVASAASDGVWVTVGAGTPVDYPETGHAQLAAIEDVSAWFAERNRLIAAALARTDGLPRELLEVGSGNGFVAASLRERGVEAAAVEPARAAAAVSAGRGVPTLCGTLEDLRLPSGTLPALGVFDVLEHVADPRPLLAEIRRVLAPGGRLAVTVPAMPALWSDSDVLAGHHRRYRRAQLIDDLHDAGFEARECRYAFAALVVPVALLRALPARLGRHRPRERQDDAGTRQVAGYGSAGRIAARAAFAAERRLRGRVDLPVGTSLLGIFERSVSR